MTSHQRCSCGRRDSNPYFLLGKPVCCLIDTTTTFGAATLAVPRASPAGVRTRSSGQWPACCQIYTTCLAGCGRRDSNSRFQGGSLTCCLLHHDHLRGESESNRPETALQAVPYPLGHLPKAENAEGVARTCLRSRQALPHRDSNPNLLVQSQVCCLLHHSGMMVPSDLSGG